MNPIKKDFQELVTFLEQNKGKKISSILEAIYSMTSTKVRQSTHCEVDGRLYVFCYYHKKWEPVDEVPYGSKAGTKTGLNTMCKEGVSKWTQKNKALKAVDGKVFEALQAGEITVEELQTYKQSLIDALESEIVPHSSGIGFDSI